MGSGISRRRRLAEGLKASVNGNAQAFGFSITITVSYGVVSVTHPQPQLIDLLLFALAGVLAFALLNVAVVLVLRGGEEDSASSRALLVGTATDFLAVGAGVGSAVGLSTLVDGRLVWVLVPFAVGCVYVALQSLELALGSEEAADDG